MEKQQESITILLFGQMTEAAGTNKVQIPNPGDLEGVKQALFSLFPELEKHLFKIAVNQELVSGNPAIGADDEIAFLPPFAGG